MQNADEALMAAGFSACEASAYCPMLTKSPANNYQPDPAAGQLRPKLRGAEGTYAGQMPALRKARE